MIAWAVGKDALRVGCALSPVATLCVFQMSVGEYVVKPLARRLTEVPEA